jgi:hypothetical protein
MWRTKGSDADHPCATGIVKIKFLCLGWATRIRRGDYTQSTWQPGRNACVYCGMTRALRESLREGRRSRTAIDPRVPACAFTERGSDQSRLRRRNPTRGSSAPDRWSRAFVAHSAASSSGLVVLGRRGCANTARNQMRRACSAFGTELPFSSVHWLIC